MEGLRAFEYIYICININKCKTTTWVPSPFLTTRPYSPGSGSRYGYPSANLGMATGSEDSSVVFRLNALWISYAHTFFAGGAFVLALTVGCLLHYKNIVQNSDYGYPDEWFPSVSATIGDRYPERSFYQIMIAVTSGPRFLLCGITYILTARKNSYIPAILLVTGILRTFTCGGWTYITSTDDHDWHDIFMISYMILTFPWTTLRIMVTPKGTKARKMRIITASLFFGSIVPLIYFFIQHKVHRIPGAYTIYAFFEWSLVLLDVAFDAATAYDFASLEITVRDPHHVVEKPTEVPILQDPSTLRRGPPVLGFIISTINWTIWWSVVTSIGAMVWYFPLWYMGISGYEAWALMLVSPLLLFVPPVKKLFTKLPQLAFLGQVVGVGAFWVTSPPDRMMWVGIGTGFAVIALAAVFSNAARSTRPGIVTSQSISFILGLMLTLAARIKSYTSNPIWPIMKPGIGGINPWGVGVGIVAAASAGLMVPDTNSGAENNKEVAKETSKPVKDAKKAKDTTKRTTKETSNKLQPKCSATIVGMGLGSLLFVMVTFLSDISNIPLFVWEGYPAGPSPMPHGLLVLVAMSIGLLLGVKSRCQTSVAAVAIFNLAMGALSQLNSWPGFAAGLVVAVYSCAVVPALFKGASVHHPAKSFGIAMLTYMGYNFASVWVVAYAFVPGGFLLRERTWVLMLTEQILISFAVLNIRKSVEISTAAKKVGKLLSWGLLFTLALSSIFAYQRLQHPVPAPVHPESQALTAGIWTIHFGLDNGLWNSETRMRDLIRDAELDVVGLLESDTQRIIGGHRDITQKIAEELGFYADYGPSADKHTWGAALLSRFPILKSEHHLTPSPVGELAPAIHATLDVYGVEVDVIVFHSGQEEDEWDRHLQTAYVSDLLASTGDRHTVLLSYLVTQPLEGNYNKWVSSHTGMHDIDPSDDDRWCEYILYKNMRRTGYARISRDTITDTELQIGRFQVTSPENTSNKLIEESAVEPGLRFPSILRGEGVRGHRYHVFDEPRYYE